MNPVDAVKSVFMNYAKFTGAATRPEFWWFYAFTVVVNAILQALSGDSQNPNPIVSAIQLVWSLGALVPSLAVTVRRFHDAGFSGKWLLLWIAPIAAWTVALGTTIVAFVQLWQAGDIETAVLTIALASVPALLLTIGVGIFQFVVTLLPSKTSDAGNKYA